MNDRTEKARMEALTNFELGFEILVDLDSIMRLIEQNTLTLESKIDDFKINEDGEIYSETENGDYYYEPNQILSIIRELREDAEVDSATIDVLNAKLEEKRYKLKEKEQRIKELEEILKKESN